MRFNTCHNHRRCKTAIFQAVVVRCMRNDLFDQLTFVLRLAAKAAVVRLMNDMLRSFLRQIEERVLTGEFQYIILLFINNPTIPAVKFLFTIAKINDVRFMN